MKIAKKFSAIPVLLVSLLLWSSPARAQVGTPTQISPANGATDQPTSITLNWSSVSLATSYEVQVSTDANFNSVTSDQSGGGTSANVSGLAQGVTYYWRVRASSLVFTGSWSTAWSFSTAAQVSPPSAPTLSSPANGAAGQPTTLVVSWNASASATHYWLQVATDQGFTSIVVGDSTVSATSYQVNYLSASTTYYWRVTALNGSGMSNWSSVWSFTTASSQIQPPPAPTLLSPSDGSTNQPTTLTLSWNAASTADHYWIQVATDQTFSNMVYTNYSIVGTSQEVGGLANNTTYYWWVRALNAGGKSDWSSIWTFTTGSGALPPPPPVVFAPANGASQQPDSLTFRWNSSQGASRYRLEISTTNAFSSEFLDDSTITDTSDFVTGFQNGTTYFWRVDGINSAGAGAWSNEWSFTTITKTQVPETPVLSSPPNGATGRPLSDTLSWDSARYAETYHLLLSSSSSFTSIIVNDSTITATSLVVGPLLAGTTYYWRLNASNSSASSPWSSTWTFTTAQVSPPPPLAPTLVLPADGATMPTPIDTLEWTHSANAQSYKLELSSSSAFTGSSLIDTSVVDTYYVAQSPHSASVYYWRVMSVAPGGNSGWSQSRSFSVSGVQTGPTLLKPADGAIGEPTRVVCLWDSVNSAHTYEIQISTDSMFTSPVFDDSGVSSTYITVDSLAGGMKYYWRVRAALSANNLGPYSTIWNFTTVNLTNNGGTMTIATTIPFPAMSDTTTVSSRDYRLIGLPGASSIPMTAVLDGSPGSDWEAYWDNGKPGDPSSYLMKYDNSSKFDFSPGRSFWIIKNGPLVVDTTVLSPTLDSLHAAEIPIHGGWNLITDPFADSISWSAVQSIDSVTEPIYSYDGTFQLSSTLRPFTGYYFFNANSRSVLPIPLPQAGSQMRSVAMRQDIPTADQDWDVTVVLSSGGYRDSTMWFGVSSKVNSDHNRYDAHKPRSLGSMPDVYFSHPEWDSKYSSFASEIHPAFDDISEWEFLVSSPPTVAARLRFFGTEQIPASFDAYLFNPVSQSWKNLRKDPTYRFVPTSNVTSFRVLIGKPDLLQKKMNASVASTINVGVNYPNPFNPSTTIPVYVSTPMEVNVSVYNVIGQRVARIYSGELKAGQHSFVWDGTDLSGRPASSGVYFYRVQSSLGAHLTRKMILLR